MNRQVDHIVYATIFLVSLGLILRFVQNLPAHSEIASTTIDSVIKPVQKTPLTPAVEKGKVLFTSSCAACHSLHKDMTGPSLSGFTTRGPWTVRQNVYDWIRNPMEFANRNEYTTKLIEAYRTQMQATPGFSNADIDAIIAYINY